MFFGEYDVYRAQLERNFRLPPYVKPEKQSEPLTNEEKCDKRKKQSALREMMSYWQNHPR